MIKSTVVQPVRADLVLGTILAYLLAAGLFPALTLANYVAAPKMGSGSLPQPAPVSGVEHQSVPAPEAAVASLSEWAFESGEHVAGTIELRWKPHTYELIGTEGATDTVGWIYVTEP